MMIKFAKYIKETSEDSLFFGFENLSGFSLLVLLLVLFTTL